MVFPTRWFSQRVGKTRRNAVWAVDDVDLFIARTDMRHDLPTTNQSAKVAVNELCLVRLSLYQSGDW